MAAEQTQQRPHHEAPASSTCRCVNEQGVPPGRR